MSERAVYDVLIVGGGPAGLSAAILCGRRRLRTAVLEEECWGGVLARRYPDKRIDDYPGIPSGIRAGELASNLVDDAISAGADLHRKRVVETARNGTVRTGDLEVSGKVLILALGSLIDRAWIPGEAALAASGFVQYEIPDPSRYRGKRVVVIGGPDPPVFHLRKLLPFAKRITLIQRSTTTRPPTGIPGPALTSGNLEVLAGARVERILGAARPEGVLARAEGEAVPRMIPADAIVLPSGAIPVSPLLRNLGLRPDSGGRVVTDGRQRTRLPGILAIGDLASPLKMIVTAVAQAAAASHEAYLQVRNPTIGI